MTLYIHPNNKMASILREGTLLFDGWLHIFTPHSQYFTHVLHPPPPPPSALPQLIISLVPSPPFLPLLIMAPSSQLFFFFCLGELKKSPVCRLIGRCRRDSCGRSDSERCKQPLVIHDSVRRRPGASINPRRRCILVLPARSLLPLICILLCVQNHSPRVRARPIEAATTASLAVCCMQIDSPGAAEVLQQETGRISLQFESCSLGSDGVSSQM